jgi:MoaA/NifB/PqqE/SkfB family radical SAM enzyme
MVETIMGYSVGIGLTNDCNLHCAHCYRDTDNIAYLPFDDVAAIVDAIPVGSIGMGTGENGLHPEFERIVRFLQERGIKQSIASNGYSIMNASDEILSAFHDVELSIDFPTEEQQDAFRGEGNWALVHQAIDRCKDLGVETSILATMMSTNYNAMDGLVQLARHDGVNLRVNAYQPVNSDAFVLNYDQFWEGYRQLFKDGLIISCAEPVVRAVLGLENVECPCGRTSIRINPHGLVLPCVYWPADGLLDISDLANIQTSVFEMSSFRSIREIPTMAESCPCQGGCASRRALRGNLDGHDEFCPWVRGDTVTFDHQFAPAKDLARIGSVCTTIVS